MTPDLLDLIKAVAIFVGMLAACEVLYLVSRAGMRAGGDR